MMKRTAAAILIAALVMSLFAACAPQNTIPAYSETHTLYFRDSTKSSKVVATFFNSGSGESEDVEMEKIREEDDAYTFSCEGDCSRFNMAYVTCDNAKIGIFVKFAFNPCVSGWYKTENDLLPYTEGEEIEGARSNEVHALQYAQRRLYGASDPRAYRRRPHRCSER